MTNLELDRVAFEAAVADRPDGSFVTRAGSGLAGGLRRVASALIFPAALLLVWLTACLLDLVPAQILPDPRLVLATFREFYETGDLAFHAQISLIRVVQGFALGAGAGLVLGISMGLSRRVRELVEPLFLALAQVPPLGWIPLVMLLVGIDEALKVIIIAKAALIPVTINTCKGILNVPRNYKEVGEVLTFGRWQTLTKILAPASIPTVFTGIRYGLTNAWLALVAVELLASSEGLGYLMVWGRQLFQLDLVIMAMIVVGVIGFVLDWSLGLVERRLQRWEDVGT
ncbi:MAG TPA: ABC transporter permease [Skermanella sp.]|jgi:sulfonate transport system permease protein|nr:ABC transporter permease [Skermanella sp.]